MLVVIKTLNREQRQKPDFAEIQKRFRKEALDLSKCYHPHIVQVYDNFPEDGLWAIVMEHIDGDDLAAYVENYTAENGYLSETEALRYIDGRFGIGCQHSGSLFSHVETCRL
jgi:serine/threonine protein kinase